MGFSFVFVLGLVMLVLGYFLGALDSRAWASRSKKPIDTRPEPTINVVIRRTIECHRVCRYVDCGTKHACQCKDACLAKLENPEPETCA